MTSSEMSSPNGVKATSTVPPVTSWTPSASVALKTPIWTS